MNQDQFIKMQVPFYSFKFQNALIKKEILTAVEKVVDSEWYILGESVKNFEQEYAAFNQVKHCIGVGNGLDALQIALKALGIQKGDEVIVPANTFIATWLAVSALGAVPVPVDPHPATYNLDAGSLESAVTARTKAVIPVHLYGQACEMESIMAAAKKHRLYVVEDNAQAQGAAYQGKMTGSFGQINATSFYPVKNLGALGDAGAITTDDEQLAAKVRMIGNYGSVRKYYNEVIGQNSRLDELQAAILSVKLPKLMGWTRERVAAAQCYLENLQGLGDLQLPETAPGATHVYHLFVIRSRHRDALQSFLAGRGIETLIHYPVPPHLQKAYRALGFSKGAFPIAEQMAQSCLSLPLYPGLKEEQIMYVCEAIKRFFHST